jgi:hypothetical protein
LEAASTATKIEAGFWLPVSGSRMGTVIPAQSTQSVSPARCSWRMTGSIRSAHVRYRLQNWLYW